MCICRSEFRCTHPPSLNSDFKCPKCRAEEAFKKRNKRRVMNGHAVLTKEGEERAKIDRAKSAKERRQSRLQDRKRKKPSDTVAIATVTTATKVCYYLRETILL